MENILIANFYIFVLVAMVGIFIGLDMKKLSSWLFVIYGFLSGFFLGLFYYDLQRGAELGGILAFAVLFAGTRIYGSRRKYERLADSWLSRYGQGDHPCLLVRIIKKIAQK